MQRGAERGGRRTWWFAVAVALLVVVWIAWWQWDAVAPLLQPGQPDDPGAATRDPGPAPTGADTAPAVETPTEQARRRWAQMLGETPAWPVDLADPQDCARVDEDLTRVCGLLDARDYIRSGSTPTGACGLFRQVAEELASRPPQFDAELAGYETMIGNVFHVFRTLGRRRTELLRRIVWEEHELAEPAALALFRWAASRQRCAGARDTPLTLDSLYAHAGFLFQTIGGQAYLRRRAPRTEGLIAFYALLILDRADAEGRNPSGLDPRPEIVRTRALLENEPLVFRDRYLQVLDDMAERWKKRSASAP